MQMTEKDASVALCSFETKHRLFDVLVDGWSAWRVLRFQVASAMMALPLSRARRAGALARMARMALGSIRLSLQLVIGRQRDAIIKSFTSALREKHDHRYRDVYFDALIDCNLDCYKIESRNSGKFEVNRRSAFRPADLDADVLAIIARLLAAFFPRRELDTFFASLEHRLHSELGVSLSSRHMQLVVSTVYWQIRLYRLLIRRLRAKYVLAADSQEYALITASRRERVRFIELQHGVFTAFHPDAVPESAPGSAEQLVLPDCLAVFGDFWKRLLHGTALRRIQVVPVGNGQVEGARRLREQNLAHDGTIHILMTSQGLDSDRLATWLERMLECAPSEQVLLTIKLHPIYDAKVDAYSALVSKFGVRIIGGADDPDVYHLLATAHLHLSIASACHFDALGIGVPTIVIPLTGHEGVVEFVDGVCMHLAERPDDVWRIAATTGDLKALARDFFASGYVSNVRALLR